MPDPLVRKLQDATDGLVYTSDKDAPFEAFEWDSDGPLTADRVRALGGHAKKAPVSESDLGEFFEPFTADEDWHDDARKESVRKYRELQAVFADDLADATVFRVGKAAATYYVVGRSAAGKWVGVKTEATET